MTRSTLGTDDKCRLLSESVKYRGHVGKKTCCWVYKIHKFLKEVEFEGVDWIQLAPDRFQ